MNPTLPSGMQEEADKMKGDAIGDTMYSERWVLKTLMKLSENVFVEYISSDDYRLEPDLEGDLGLLWDMTIEADVAKFLVEHDALGLIEDILKFNGSPRLTEIMIGILGNLACEESARQKIDCNEGLIKVIINLLNFTDSPTLVQLVRLLTTCIWDMGKKAKKRVENASSCDSSEDDAEEVTSHWIKCLKVESEMVCRSISFILASSRNGELLTATLGLLESLFNLTWYDNDYFCKQFSMEECIKALIEALKEVIKHTEDIADSHANHQRVRDACGHWITIMHRMTYHQMGTNALAVHADVVFDLVSSQWIDQMASRGCIGCSALHLTLALELLEALLPLSSHHCQIGNVVALLEVPPEEWEGEEEVVTGLRTTLEDFCLSTIRQWLLKGVDVEGEFSLLKGRGGQLSILEGLLAKRLDVAESSSASSDGMDVKLVEIMKIIKEVKVDQ